ncbi:MAG: dehydratase [Chloroflexi bacterium]|nr:dehydratase [Chloroflexota bacterium]MBT3863351.1 dehydratase [Chloroflexota bacterium]MBT4142722.1 dehydratase [Chloroflexota bacterium]MBT4342301.1 dehydratase [Chloroflexota bacterium]MBT4942638.1 dehydratase [Chloroflexota bacterium]
MAITKSQTPMFEDVSVGDELPELVKHPDNRQLVMYAGASQDFVAIHYDLNVAKEAGHPNVIIHGALKSAWLGELVTGWIGSEGRLLELDVSYRAIDFPGDTATCVGKIIDARIEDGVGLVEIEIGLRNPEGAISTPGRALVSLPTRS